MEGKESVGAMKASSIVKEYISNTYGNLGVFTFRIKSIGKNSREDIWIVECETYTTAKDTTPTQYTIKVNIANGTIESVNSM